MIRVNLMPALMISALLHLLVFVGVGGLNLANHPLQFQFGKSAVSDKLSQNVALVQPQVQIDLTGAGTQKSQAQWKSAGSFSYLSEPGMSVPPKALSSNTLPSYPQMALERNWQGVVLIRAEISSEGLIQSIFLEKSCGYPALDQSAMEAVRNWKFTQVKAVIRVPVRFEIR